MTANAVEVATVMVRNVILARLLSVEQFGLSATFSIMMTLIETFQNIGLNRMIVQDQRADDPRFLANLHGAQIVVGLAAACLMSLLVWPYAFAMATPGLVGGYLVMAAIPLINSFVNLETFRVQREGRFGPQAIRSILSQPIGLLALFPAYWWLGDYRTAIVAIFAQQTSAVLLTHFAVRRRFTVAFDRQIWSHAFAFGWPLVLNGLLMFLVVNGDRTVVSREFGPATLGWFSVALMLTFQPASLIAKTLQTIALPQMSKVQNDLTALQRQFDLLSTLCVLGSLLLVVSAALVAKPAVELLFGAKFLPAAEFLPLLAGAQGLRLVRAVPTITAMACGETKNPLYANIVRGSFIPVALAVAILTRDVPLMIFVGLIGEMVALLAAGWLAQRWAGLSSRYFLKIVISATASMGFIAASQEIHWMFAVAALPALGAFLAFAAPMLPPKSVPRD